MSGSDCDYLLLICVPNRLYCVFGSANLQVNSQQRSTPQVVGTVWSSVMVDQSQEAVLQSLFTSFFYFLVFLRLDYRSST